MGVVKRKELRSLRAYEINYISIGHYLSKIEYSLGRQIKATEHVRKRERRNARRRVPDDKVETQAAVKIIGTVDMTNLVADMIEAKVWCFPLCKDS